MGNIDRLKLEIELKQTKIERDVYKELYEDLKQSVDDCIKQIEDYTGEKSE